MKFQLYSNSPYLGTRAFSDSVGMKYASIDLSTISNSFLRLEDLVDIVNSYQPLRLAVINTYSFDGIDLLGVDNLNVLVAYLLKLGLKVEIETLGQELPLELPVQALNLSYIQYNLNVVFGSENVEVLKKYLELWASNQLSILFKFSVPLSTNFVDIKHLEMQLGIPKHLILLQREEPSDYRLIEKLALDNDYRILLS